MGPDNTDGVKAQGVGHVKLKIAWLGYQVSGRGSISAIGFPQSGYLCKVGGDPIFILDYHL